MAWEVFFSALLMCSVSAIGGLVIAIMLRRDVFYFPCRRYPLSCLRFLDYNQPQPVADIQHKITVETNLYCHREDLNWALRSLCFEGLAEIRLDGQYQLTLAGHMIKTRILVDEENSQ